MEATPQHYKTENRTNTTVRKHYKTKTGYNIINNGNNNIIKSKKKNNNGKQQPQQ